MFSTRSQFVSGALGAGIVSTLIGPRAARAADAPVLKIGCTIVESQAEAYYADELGFFKKNGLAVEITAMKGGAATVAAVTGGGLNVGCSNPVSIAQAVQRGVPLVVLVGGSIWDSKFPTGYAVVSPTSGMKSAKELDGQVVAVSSLGGLNELLMRAYIARDGGNPATVKFIELPPSATSEALTQGRVAAGYLDVSDLISFGNKLRRLGPASDAVASQFAQTVWFTSKEWLAQNKDIAAKFVASIITAGKWAMANPEAAAGVLDKRMNVKTDKGIIRYATAANPGLVQAVLDSASKNKLLPPLHASEFVWDGK